MKNHIKTILWSGIVVVMLGLVSCEEYLDREPESILDEETAFKNFVNFQSYTEELYSLIPDLAKHSYTSDFNWGEDIVTSLAERDKANVLIDNGDYMSLLGKWDCFLDRSWDNMGTGREKAIWGPSWYGIRKANVGLANLDLLTDANEEEKRLIEGQLRFFRGWFHFQLIQYWGPMPYIGTVLPADEPLRLERPKYSAVADSIALDFERAAELLPFHWDNTETGQRTLGYNRWRLNKVQALGYLAKNYLWAASPLMNQQSTGNTGYDQEYAKKAAGAAAQVLKYIENGDTWHELLPWEEVNSIFYTVGEGWLIPGGNEAIFQAPNYHAQSSNWNNTRCFAPVDVVGRNTPVYAPSANYVNYYGMANGLPLDDPESGFDPEHPWQNRDPRFYKDFIYDGVKFVQGPMSVRAEPYRHAGLHTGGLYRDEETGSRTGYLVYKWIPITANNVDSEWDQADALTIHHTYMRVADMYLMYAEAAAVGYQSSAGKDPDYSRTATDAVNVVRNRAGVGELAAGLSLDEFMSELRRERAVELSFEGHRFNDLRRWLLLTEYPYNIKTAQEFDRPEAGYDFEADDYDPSTNRVLNFREEVIIERKLVDKHYWLPIRVGDANIYEDFSQNPGW